VVTFFLLNKNRMWESDTLNCFSKEQRIKWICHFMADKVFLFDFYFAKQMCNLCFSKGCYYFFVIVTIYSEQKDLNNNFVSCCAQDTIIFIYIHAPYESTFLLFLMPIVYNTSSNCKFNCLVDFPNNKICKMKF